jgi:magnesium chelatase family protein
VLQTLFSLRVFCRYDAVGGAPRVRQIDVAHRFAGLLPDMPDDEALESAAIQSLSGRFSMERWGIRPTGTPHHSASAVALVGGGSPPRPGEISLAHHGVLFLDEFPEFKRSALEALREPLESGTITISRAAQRSEFPARFQLIGAMNPCPCGFLGASHHACRCTPDQINRYQSKLSGPLMDRIDLHVEVPALPTTELLGAPPGESTQSIRARCTQARERAIQRQGKANQALAGREINLHAGADAAALQFLQTAAAKLGWSARGTHRTLKIARTIADLADSASTQLTHVAEAMQYRHRAP